MLFGPEVNVSNFVPYQAMRVESLRQAAAPFQFTCWCWRRGRDQRRSARRLRFGPRDSLMRPTPRALPALRGGQHGILSTFRPRD
jgi:hypothetical protein